MSPWYKIGLLCVGGALGAVARFGLGNWVQAGASARWSQATYFPWGTLVVNLLGCFLFGVAWSYLENHHREAAAVRLLILGGFLGAFTTFSTLVFDVVQLAETRWLAAALNLAAHNLAGIVVLIAGAALGRLL